MKFLEKNVVEYDTNKKQKIMTALRSFPRMKMRVSVKNFDSETNTENNEDFVEGGEAVVSVDLFKQNFNIDNRVIVQKHKKIKDVTWWIAIGDTDNNLLALKKVSVKKRVNLKIQIDVPDNLKKTKIHAYLMADSYIGLDQALQLKFKRDN